MKTDAQQQCCAPLLSAAYAHPLALIEATRRGYVSMRLIKRVRVQGLRSIEDAELSDVSSLVALVGRNSSGKSNLLRALNMFFNGEMEPGKPFMFARDHFEQLPRKRTKKRVAVAVDFALPESFKFRQGMRHLETLGSAFTITRAWEIHAVTGVNDLLELTKAGEPVANGAEWARQFISLIAYRYIPNRSVPANLLKEESQAIAASIFSRMKGDTHSSALMDSLAGAAARMLETANSSLATTGSPITAPSVATRDTIGEMLTMSGFTGVGAHGLPVQDEDWGSGHQAYFLYDVLRILDTSYGRFFGWRQATIWGVEEPESALHRDLETRLAEQFRTWCFDDSYRLQVFTTTHSPIFTMSAESGYWVELDAGRTLFQGMSVPELTHACETKGVGGWVHPILYFPWNPVVLVEGPLDAEVLTHVSRIAGLQHLRFVSLPNLDPNSRKGGKDQIISFLKNSHGLVQNRSSRAPLFVLFDWEVSDQDMRKAEAAYGAGGNRFVMRMSAKYADSMMSDDFRGIERFYPPRIVMEAHEAGEITLAIRVGRPHKIAQSDLAPAKKVLRDRILKVDSPKDLAPLIQCMLEIEAVLREEHPVQMSLRDMSD